MLIRRPGILLASYGNLFSISCTTSTSSTSSKQRETSTRPPAHLQRTHRRYATAASDSEHDEIAHYSWPEPPKGHSCPTPYQIFAMQTNAAYTKVRYYELVKLYHPDRTGTPHNDIPQAVKTERYRLIVSAHAILSDPTRRSAYDRFGAGWDGRSEVGGRDTWHQGSPTQRPGPFSQSWSEGNDPIWNNATWEDWERFYAWRARKEGRSDGFNQPKQSPLYFKNSYFLLMVALLAMMGSSANYSRAQDVGTYYVEQRDIIHDRAAKELRKVKQDATQSGSKQDRIEWFLRNREATLGLADDDATETLRREKIDRLLPDREICRSEEVVQKEPRPEP